MQKLRKDFSRFIFIFFSVMLSFWVSAQTDGHIKRPGEDRLRAPKIWREMDVPIPDSPSEENFKTIELASVHNFDLKVDVSSLSLSQDGVVRFAYALVSDDGLANVFYEGFRCETTEYKTYAVNFGYDNPWNMVKEPQWRRIGKGNMHRMDLMRFHLCPLAVNPYSQDAIKESLRYGKLRRLDRSGNRW